MSSDASVTSEPPVRIGLVGFGIGGNYFHAPFIEAARGVELAGVVTRSTARQGELAERFPGVPAYESLAAMIQAETAGAGLHAVTITTPPETRRELVLQALGQGLHVVADKPFAPDEAGARALRDTADDAGLVLAVYHNRRWDSDIVTLRGLLDSGRLGVVSSFHSTMDQNDPGTIEGGPGGGLLRDLGSHLVDQALWLFGPARAVFASLDWADTASGPTDVGFILTIRHQSGVTSVLTATKRNHVEGRSLRVYGDAGSYLVNSVDIQAAASLRGERPAADPRAWGYEPESAWGTLHAAGGVVTVPARQGSYVDYYEQFAAAVRHQAPAPVTASEAVELLQVLDAARESDATGRASLPMSSGLYGGHSLQDRWPTNALVPEGDAWQSSSTR